MHLFTIVTWVTYSLSALTLIGGLFVVAVFAKILFLRLHPSHVWAQKIQSCLTWIGQRAYLGIFVIALTATLGSLFYSEIAHFVPCVLCWYQRIAMYPLVLTSFIAYRHRDVAGAKYMLPAALIGISIALYHYILQIVSLFAEIPETFLPCSTVGMTASCTSSHFMTFGYITIPMMSLTAFVMICTLLYLQRRSATTILPSAPKS